MVDLHEFEFRVWQPPRAKQRPRMVNRGRSTKHIKTKLEQANNHINKGRWGDALMANRKVGAEVRALSRQGGNFTRVYTPKETVEAEAEIRRIVRQEIAKQGWKHTFEEWVEVEAWFWLEIPKSWPKWKKDAAAICEVKPQSTPDLDNYLKLVLDAINDAPSKKGERKDALLWTDDKIVTDVVAKKRYTANRPHTHVIVRGP